MREAIDHEARATSAADKPGLLWEALLILRARDAVQKVPPDAKWTRATAPTGPPRPRCKPTCQLNTWHFRIKLRIYGEVTVGVGLPCWLSAKESACNAGDSVSVPGSGRSPGEGNGNPFQYPCLEKPMERGTWQAAVHGAAKSWTRLND